MEASFRGRGGGSFGGIVLEASFGGCATTTTTSTTSTTNTTSTTSTTNTTATTYYYYNCYYYYDYYYYDYYYLYIYNEIGKVPTVSELLQLLLLVNFQ